MGPSILVLATGACCSQGVFLAMGVWAFPTGNVKGRQEIKDYFGQFKRNSTFSFVLRNTNLKDQTY